MPRTKNEALHAAREQQILDAARKCFIAYGFHSTSMRQILDAADISAGGAYNYFAGKDDIVLALVEAERADIDLLLKRLTDSDSPLDGLSQLVYDSIAYYSHDDAVLAAEIYAEACRNAAIEKVIQANVTRLSRLIQSTISRGQNNLVIVKTYSALDLTEWLLALVDGSISRIAVNPKLNPKQAARIAKQSAVAFLSLSHLSN